LMTGMPEQVPGPERAMQMSKLTTPLEVYKLMPKTNCGDCGVSACMAFAAAIIKREKQLADCPYLDKGTIARHQGRIDRPVNLENIQEDQLKELREKVSATNIITRMKLLGGRSNGEMVVIQCLGKDFEIDAHGMVISHCHTHAWFSIPLLNYILFSKGENVSGRWMPFRELRMGKKWNPLFERRCELPLKYIADTHAELFEDLISMFSGTSSFNTFDSDISVVLYPLPKVPVLICYWKPEEDLESRLHVFFDETAEQNMPIESLFTLGTGLVRMLEKIVLKHSLGMEMV
jgi:hypothetical protein